MNGTDDGATLRIASQNDSEALLDIYAPYVRDTAITFEYDVPSETEFRRRISTTLEKHPFIVVERDGALLGYAYTSPFGSRAAYDWTAKTSIYLKTGCTKRGLGKKLYAALESVSKAQRIAALYACIAWSETEDDRLTDNSIRFHERMGYTPCGTFRDCGFKFGGWYGVVWMEKRLATRPGRPDPIIPFPALPPDALRSAGITVQR